MRFEGTYQIKATPERVWELLNTAEILRSSIPGCEELVQTSPVNYDAVVTLKVGLIKARFKGSAEMTEQQPPNQCVIAFRGSGGIAGTARGEAKVLLTPTDDGTQLVYTADVLIGGKIAQIGSKLIEGTAKKIADQFFSNFTGRVIS